MDDMNRVSCVMCHQREETEMTGALSTKDEVTAHQNCLLFSSGLFCRNSPQFDDLFGFSVEDVLNEVKRGSKLNCNKCKKKGATAGCEVTRCKKSYHYPCSVLDGATTVENADQGKYGLYCFNHYQQIQRHNGCVNGRPSSSTKSLTSKSSSEAGSSKVYCLTCQKMEGNISLDSLSNSIVMLYCTKHAPVSHQRNTNGDSTTASRLSACSSDSNSCSGVTPSSSKRKLNFRDKQEGTPSKRKAWNVILTDDSSDSGDWVPDPEMEIFAPLETDLDENANSVPETQLIRKDNESPSGSTSGNQVVDRSINGDDDEDETIIHSDAESESLLLPVSQSPSVTTAVVSTQTAPAMSPCVVLCKIERAEESSPDQSPVHSPAEHAAVPQQSSSGPPPSPYRPKPLYLTRSLPCTSSAMSPAPPISISLPPSPFRPPHYSPFPLASHSHSPSPPLAPPSDPELGFDSTSFWKSCNAAGCTQALFTGFINEMNDISSRIQSDLASQEDCDRALTVMTASGKLAELVAKQQEELQRKQTELLKATAAMKEVVAALKTCVRQQIL